MIQEIIKLSMANLIGEIWRLPMVGGTFIADRYYHLNIFEEKDLKRGNNAIFSIRAERWTLQVPANINMRRGNVDLDLSATELFNGARDDMQHDMTIVAMFVDN